MGQSPSRARRCTIRPIRGNDAIKHDARLVQRVSFTYFMPHALYLVRHAKIDGEMIPWPKVIIRHIFTLDPVATNIDKTVIGMKSSQVIAADVASNRRQ
jgi:hypothetical protein